MKDQIRGVSLHPKFYSVVKSKFTHLCLLLIILLCCALLAKAQVSPGRFEAGGNITIIRTDLGGNFGPGLEGDLNLGRHFALDGTYNWLPANRPVLGSGHMMQGFFGGKVGTRTQRFGFFGKVRPGFVSIGDTLRQQIVDFTNPLAPTNFTRFSRLTERALDYGGVFEYYPGRHWALRYDAGDTVLFEEAPQITIISPFPLGLRFPSNRTTHHFQFSTSLHYRF
jgi:hypothetical protein